METKRIYGIASYQRPQQLIRCVQSIFDQADIIHVALNCYDEIPVELYDKKIVIHICDNSKGDAFKFLALNNSEGYYFSCDDDIIYPADYSRFIIEHIEKYKRKSIISLHGRSFSKFPVPSYYRSSVNRVYCLRELIKDTEVQFGGTGVMAFHTDLMKIPIDYFVYPNMADVFIGKYAKENNIKTVCVKHGAGYIIQQETKDNIYSKTCRDDSLQTEIVNNLFGCAPKKLVSIPQPGIDEVECEIIKEKFGNVGQRRFYHKDRALVYQQMGFIKII
jgi:hypothetical protein